MKRSIFSLLMLILSFVACKKKTEETPSRSVLIVKSWQLTAAVASPAFIYQGISISNLYFFLPPCDADDLYIFKTDKTIEVQEGSSANCSNGNPPNQVKSTGTWSLNSDETKLTFKAGVYDFQGDILEITTTQMKLRADASAFSSYIPSGVTIPAGTKVDVTFTAK